MILKSLFFWVAIHHLSFFLSGNMYIFFSLLFPYFFSLPKPLTTSRFRIPKSRYDSISHYLSVGPGYSGGCCNIDLESAENPIRGDYYKPKYNDIELVYDKDIFQQLKDSGNESISLLIAVV